MRASRLILSAGSLLSWVSLVRAVKNGDVKKNEIADHSWKLDHRFDWDKKTIIDREQNWTVQKIKETIHSISDKNNINIISHSLSEIWLSALN